MRVSIADFNQETLDLAQKNLKGDVKCFKIDVGDRGAWKNLKEQVGDVDFLMLNAGVGGKGSWGDEEYFDKVSLMVRGRRLGVLKCTDLTHKLKRCYQWTE
jgi:NADP-dependent 3-hydroxy acid dehydrogenase YdfG